MRDGGGATRTFGGRVSSQQFLSVIDSQHRSTVDLVLNGDTFELPSDEAGALTSLDRVLAAHKAEVQALASFAKAGTNRIVLIPGDRDSALRFGKVAERVTRALGGSADRVTAASSGYWISRDGKVHAEHGHEIRFRTQDSGALQELYDKIEAKYPAVDNVAIAASGAKYAARGRQHAVVRRGRRAPRARRAPECLLAAVPDGARRRRRAAAAVGSRAGPLARRFVARCFPAGRRSVESRWLRPWTRRAGSRRLPAT